MDDKVKRVLLKIREHSLSIINETAGLNTAEEFKNNNDKSKAALFDLMQIGELAKDGLSRDTIANTPNIPWKQIYNLRNRIVHGYASVDYQIIFETIQDDIPKLVGDIDAALLE